MKATIILENRGIECTYRDGIYLTKESVSAEEFASKKVEILCNGERKKIKRARAEITKNNGVYRVILRERTEEEAREEKRKKVVDKNNKWTAQNCDRVSVVLPKGTKERIAELGFSVNGFINEAVKAYLDAQG